jgi:hypothetical protein
MNSSRGPICLDLLFKVQMMRADECFRTRCRTHKHHTGRDPVIFAPAGVKARRKRVSQTLNFHIVSRQEFACFVCHTKLHGKCWDIDHWVPRCEGGADHMDNYVGLCTTCHGRKTHYEKIWRFDGCGWHDSFYYKSLKAEFGGEEPQHRTHTLTHHGGLTLHPSSRRCKICNVVFSRYFTHTCVI